MARVPPAGDSGEPPATAVGDEVDVAICGAMQPRPDAAAAYDRLIDPAAIGAAVDAPRWCGAGAASPADIDVPPGSAVATAPSTESPAASRRIRDAPLLRFIRRHLAAYRCARERGRADPAAEGAQMERAATRGR
jgi:hypothetical protein